MTKKLSRIIALALFAGFFAMNFALAQDGVGIGDEAPDFSLKNVNGEMVSFDTFEDADGYIVIFTCNHCPYSKLYEDRIIELTEEMRGENFQVIAINPNDPEQYPSDSYENMKVRAEEKGFNFPYLFDETQEIAQAYGAERTPHVFIINKEEDGNKFVSYIGAIDDNPKHPEEVSEHWVKEAVGKIKRGEHPDPATTKAIGCSIKWRKS